MSERFDLVIAGAGTAGLPCAITAAGRGARVLLADKMPSIGGTLHLSGGHMSGAGTRRQRALGIEDSVDRHWADIVRISRGSAREDLTKQAVALAPAMLDWLDEGGFPFHEVTPRIVYGHEPYEVPRTVYGVNEGRTLLEHFQALLQPYLESGAVTLWLKSPVRRLLPEGRGVAGIEVEKGGETVRALARAVVLATGGYAASPALFAEIDGKPLVSAAFEGATGDGIVMAREVGGTVKGASCYLPTFGGLPSPDDPGKAQWKDRPLLVAAERPPWEIYVDRKGRRFIAEDEPSVDLKERALAALPDLTFFTVFDDRAVDASPNIVVGWSAADLRARAGKRAGVFQARTIDELAERAGLDRPGLAATVGRYNAGVEAGRDPELPRKHLPAKIDRPPFYAMQNHGITLITFAGVDVDGELRVRRADGSVIENLYAAGEILGAAALMGDSFCSGMMVGGAVSFGRRLGGRLAPASTGRRT